MSTIIKTGGGVPVQDYEALQAQLNSLQNQYNSLNSRLDWTLAGQVTGTTAVSIPSTAKEVFIKIMAETGWGVSAYHVIASLTDDFQYYINGGPNDGFTYGISKTKYQLNNNGIYLGGKNYASTSVSYVYYR